MRGAVMPALLYKEPRNVRPARTIAITTIVLTVAALAIEYGASAAALAIAIGLSVVEALILATAALARGRGAIAVIGLPLLSLGLFGAYRSGAWLFLVTLCLAGTAALGRASYCCRLTVPTTEGWKRRNEIEGLKFFLGVAEAIGCAC